MDKFAAVLTAEQIRRLYNTEGEIGTNIKRAAVDRRRNQNTRLKGSGRMVTQDWGKAGDYTGISAAAFFDVTVSPTARTISVTADDNVIDYLVLERDGGTLKFRVNANNTENISVSVVVPASAALRQISAGSYGKVTCKLPLKGPSVAVSVSSYGSVIADIDTLAPPSSTCRAMANSRARYAATTANCGFRATGRHRRPSTAATTAKSQSGATPSSRTTSKLPS